MEKRAQSFRRERDVVDEVAPCAEDTALTTVAISFDDGLGLEDKSGPDKRVDVGSVARSFAPENAPHVNDIKARAKHAQERSEFAMPHLHRVDGGGGVSTGRSNISNHAILLFFRQNFWSVFLGRRY